MSRIVVNGRVKHKVFGNGTIINTNHARTEVSFDNNTTKSFQTYQLLDAAFFVDADDRVDKNIKIEHITVKNLFERLDYDIDINTINNVAILTAPNGCGKTTIFKLINFLFNPQPESYEEIESIPFDTFICTLSNLKTFGLAHLGDENDLILKISNGDIPILEKNISEMLHNNTIPDFYSSFDNIDDEIEYSEYFTGRGLSYKRKAFADLNCILDKKDCKPKLDFIEANRLQKAYYSRGTRNKIAHDANNSYRSPLREVEKIDYLIKANEEMTRDINVLLQDYNRKLTDAKNKLTSMYLKINEDHHADFEKFKRRWNGYHSELQKFHEIGLLESTETVIKPSELKDAYENKASFLTTYLDAFEGTLEPLQKKYDRLKLFADIFNRRNEITMKTVKFCPTGIKVFSGEKEIRIDCLSSGEKNDFVMFYRLIFNTPKYGIVLIDEPEISLHIEWQEEYLDRLLDICKMNDLQAIVATHSPNIVNGHFDLFVDKG